jgi:hypothetical protein
MIDTTADLAAFLTDWGGPVVVNGTPGQGVLSRNSQILLDDQLVYEGDSLLCPAALASTVRRGHVVTVEGVAFVACGDPFFSADGLLCRVPLSGSAPTVAATTEDLSFLSDWGEPVTIRGTASTGVLSRQTQIFLAGGRSHVGDSLLTSATLAASLRRGETIQVGAASYRVQHDPWVSVDGVLCRVPLSGPIVAPPPVTPWETLTTVGGLALTTVGGDEIAILPRA